MELPKGARLKEECADMATKDDIVDFANRGIDQMFPARRIARMAGLTSATQALNKAKQGATEKEFNDAMSDAEKTRASYVKDVKNAIFKKATPTQMDEFTSQPKNSGRFDLEGMDKGYKKGGKVTASTRADGIAQRGKTKGRIC
jgi:hypothetical protein